MLIPDIAMTNSCRNSWLVIVAIIILAAFMGSFIVSPWRAAQKFGVPSPSLGILHKTFYSIQLLLQGDDLFSARNPAASEDVFIIPQGESVGSISKRLENAGYIWNSSSFKIYLAWKGYDVTLQAGKYNLSPSMTGLVIAQRLQNPLPTEAVLTVLPGWRMEEIADSLVTSGLTFSPDVFMESVKGPQVTSPYFPAGTSAEGFLFPGQYTVSRETTAQQLVALMIINFNQHLTYDLQDGFNHHNLTVYQAVILASIVQREAVHPEEMATIASVFYNRLAERMKLESDPTVQYALGYNPSQGAWWTNPLSFQDLQVDSPFNSYLHFGLPPTPISNPGSTALHAVAYPADTTYYYFMARCDGSGWHNFAETFDQHQANTCP